MLILNKVCNALQEAGVRYAIVGGHAVALHGAVRGTVDIDIAITWTRNMLERAESALAGIGLESRLPITAKDVFDFRDEYINNRNLVAWNFYNPGNLAEQVDIIIAYDLKGRRTKTVTLSGGPVRILHIDDLIAMKRSSGRPQDKEDVSALERIR
jgi:predicted nucleotidyltransferase